MTPLTSAGLVLAAILAGCGGLDDPAAGSSTAAADDLGAGNGTLALTTEGLVRGTATATTREFRGIPYAAAPVGELRWKPPRRHAGWTGVLDASRFANHCPQPVSALGQVSATEDCLFLNVFAPSPRRGHDAPDPGPRPVMVWIHGGAFFAGESDDYDATRLVEQGDVVLVTINYRLGALGFLAHPALTAESPDHASGNYGLMDQQEALRWVQRNIRSFGGDPQRVTIFGESAGGLSVHVHLTTPGSQGLFHRAIVQSGTYQPVQPTLAAGEASGVAFASRAGCTDQSAACLRGLSVAQVLASQASPGTASVTIASAVIDHQLLSQSVLAALASGPLHRVPIMEGTTHDEWSLFVAASELMSRPLTADGYPAAIAAVAASAGVPVAAAPAILAQYPLDRYPNPSLALVAAGTDGVFACNARFAQQQLARRVPTYAYEFSDANAPQRIAPPVSFPYGASHATENQYLFTLPITVPAPPLDDDQERLSEAMIAYWTRFARTGQPTAPDAPRWPRFQPGREVTQSLLAPLPAPNLGFAADHHCAFWDSLRQ